MGTGDWRVESGAVAEVFEEALDCEPTLEGLGRVARECPFLAPRKEKVAWLGSRELKPCFYVSLLIFRR